MIFSLMMLFNNYFVKVREHQKMYSYIRNMTKG